MTAFEREMTGVLYQQHRHGGAQPLLGEGSAAHMRENPLFRPQQVSRYNRPRV
jgi:hypothetical protein